MCKKTEENVIKVDISFYHPNDDESVRVYDEEGMLEEFQYKLDCIIKNAGL
jgi:myo-inositol catabolism protein IolC